jgi:signal peptidase II
MNIHSIITAGLLARWCAVLCSLVCCVGCDQVTKQLAISRLKGHAARSFCGDLVRLDYAENPGAFLGLGGQMPGPARWAVLVVVNGAVAACVAGMLLARRRISVLSFAACALLLAGAIGNLIDRLRFDGRVVDFLNLGVGPLRTGIFNVADMAIMAGALLLVLGSLTGPDPSLAALREGSRGNG